MKRIGLIWVLGRTLVMTTGLYTLATPATAAESAATATASASDSASDLLARVAAFDSETAGNDAPTPGTRERPDPGIVIAATPSGDASPGFPIPDLAAMVLRTSDLDVSGYVQRFGTLATLETTAVRTGESVAALRAEGLGPFYQNKLQNRAAPNKREPFQWVRTEIWDFPDADAARHYHGAVANYDLAPGYRIVPGDRAIGSETLLVEGDCVCGGQSPDRVLSLVFRRGALVARVTIGNRDGTEGTMPDQVLTQDVPTIERLATILSKRMAAVLAQGPGEGIGPMSLHLDDGRREYDHLYDDYRRLGGQDFPFWYETADDVAYWQDRLRDIVDFYFLNETVDDAGETITYGSFVYRFTTAEATSADIDRQRRLTESDGWDVTQVDASPFGDDSTAYVETNTDEGLYGSVIAARVGTIEVQIFVQRGSASSRETMETLMAAQIACVENGGCTGPVPFPDDCGMS